MEPVFGLILLGIVAVVAWCVASEGPFGAGLTFLCVLFAGLLAMNFFETVAGMLDGLASGMREYSDFVALVGLFALFTFLGRLATDNIAPSEIEYDARVYQAARWLFGLAAGYTTMAILLTALHTAPLPRSFMGFAPERQNLFDAAAPDRQWLGFMQRVSEKVFRTGVVFDGFKEPVEEPPEVDGRVQDIWPSFPIRYATRRQDFSLPRARTAGVSSATGEPAKGGAPAGPSGPVGPAPAF
jgi:hypothetical protein